MSCDHLRYCMVEHPEATRRLLEIDRLRHALAVRRRLLLTVLRRHRVTRDEGVRMWLVLCEVSALVEAPGPRTEREVDAIRAEVARVIHPRGEL